MFWFITKNTKNRKERANTNIKFIETLKYLHTSDIKEVLNCYFWTLQKHL